MKKLYIIAIALCGMVMLSSCDEWLEKTSSTNIPAEKLLETRDGYLDALSGVYISFCDEDLYGGYMTWGVLLDGTSYPYVKSISTLTQYVQNHQYDARNVKAAISALWMAAYNSLANINYLLMHLESDGSGVIVNETEYKLYKAEVLALRAYILFDMLRIFGIQDWNNENASKLTIPYIKEYTERITPQLSYQETAKLLWEDINTSLELLRETEPLLMDAETLEDFESHVNLDGFWSNRQLHMNYYAVTGLAARVSQWENNPAKAAEYAGEVIDGAFSNKLVSWFDPESLISSTTDNEKDWTFSTEHLFAIRATGLYERVVGSGMFDTSGTLGGLSIPESFVNDVLFVRADPVTGSQAGAEDVRGPAMHLKQGALGYLCYKYYGSSGYTTYRNQIPMVRISEMYYILAENHIAQGDNASAISAINEVRKHRGISDDLPSSVDAESELMKEYYREFIGEGQLFYYLKHKKVNSSLSDLYDVSYTKLIFPYPDTEVNYGRIQEL